MVVYLGFADCGYVWLLSVQAVKNEQWAGWDISSLSTLCILSCKRYHHSPADVVKHIATLVGSFSSCRWFCFHHYLIGHTQKNIYVHQWLAPQSNGGIAAAAPPPFRPGNLALCGSRPLVTPYNCRLGDLLCLFLYAVFVCYFVCACICVICLLSVFLGCFPLQLSPSVLWYCWLGLLTCKNRLPYNLYCVGGDVKHCTIQSNPSVKWCSHHNW